MSKFIHKSHNATVLLYHLVFPAKYRRVVLDTGVDKAIASVFLEIEKCYGIKLLEIGSDDNFFSERLINFRPALCSNFCIETEGWLSNAYFIGRTGNITYHG